MYLIINVGFEPARSPLDNFPTLAILHTLDLVHCLSQRADERSSAISSNEVKALAGRPGPRVVPPVFGGSA